MENLDQVSPQMRQILERWQGAIQAINQCYEKSVKTPQFLSNLINKSDPKSMFEQLRTVMVCNLAFIKDEVKKKAAAFADVILKQYANGQNFLTANSYYFAIFFNFKISYKLKKFFTKSVSQFRVKERQTIGNLYEKALITIIGMLQQLQQNAQSRTLTETLQVETISSPYQISIDWPTDKIEVYQTIIIIGKILLQNLGLEDQSYGIQLANIFRRYTQLLLSKDFLQTQTKLVENLLDFWKQFLVQNFFICDDDKRQKEKKFFNILIKICTWEDLYEGMLKIIYLYSPVTFQKGLDLNIYNFLVLDRHWEIDTFYILKQNAIIVLTQLIQLDANSQEKISEKYCKQLIWSIIFSLQKLVKQEHLIHQIQKKTCIDILQLLVAVLRRGKWLDKEQQKHLLENILLPLFEYYIQEILPQYKDDIQNFTSIIDDCCANQNQEVMSCKIAKAVQVLVDSNHQSHEIVFQLVIGSLLKNKSHILQFGYQSEFPQRKIKNTTGFILLSIFMYQSQSIQEYIESLKEIFQAEYIALLSEIQVALIYHFFSYVQIGYFYDTPIKEQLIQSALVPNMTKNLRIFALDFLWNLDINLLTREHILQLISIFSQIGSMQRKYTILENAIIKRLEIFQPEDFMMIIDSCFTMLEKELAVIYNALQNRSRFDASQISYCFNLCQKIGREKQVLEQNQLIVEKLWFLVLQIHQIKYINFDDQLLRIANELLDNIPTLPVNMTNIFNEVKQAFTNCEYQGYAYYQFFQKVNRKCTWNNIEIIKNNQQTMVEVAIIFMLHPQLDKDSSCLTLQNYVSLCDSLWVIHSMLFNKLQDSTHFLSDVKSLLDQFPKFNAKTQLNSCILVRFMNLTLSFACIESQIEIDYQLILDLANRKKFRGYEARLLVYLFTALLPKIKQKDQVSLWIIFIYLLRTDQETSKNKPKDTQNRNKFNTLLAFIEPPVLIQRYLHDQIKIFASTFQQIDFKGYQISLNKLKQADYQQINQFLNGNLHMRKLVRAGEIKAILGQTCKVVVSQSFKKLKSILRYEEDQENFQRLPVRSSPFEMMQHLGHYSDQEDKQLITNASRLTKKTRLEIHETKKQMSRLKQLNKQRQKES